MIGGNAGNLQDSSIFPYTVLQLCCHEVVKFKFKSMWGNGKFAFSHCVECMGGIIVGTP